MEYRRGELDGVVTPLIGIICATYWHNSIYKEYIERQWQVAERKLSQEQREKLYHKFQRMKDFRLFGYLFGVLPAIYFDRRDIVYSLIIAIGVGELFEALECDKVMHNAREEILEDKRDTDNRRQVLETKYCESLRKNKIDDEALFKQPPPKEDCPICFIQKPALSRGGKYMACCGKDICSGCIYAVESVAVDGVIPLCPFCRSPAPTSAEEIVERTKKRVKVGDAQAICNIGDYYYSGILGFQQDDGKTLEHWHQAAELGWTTAYNNIGTFYYTGRFVEMDKKKARHYYNLAAMGGGVGVRHSLGCMELREGNIDLAIKHWTIAIKGGFGPDLDNVKRGIKLGMATKDDYLNALQAYEAYLSDIMSAQRDKAAMANDRYLYYSKELKDWGEVGGYF